MKKTQKTVSIVLLSVLLFAMTFSLCGCTKTAEDYTLEEHIKNISKRIEQEYLNDGEAYRIYPLYSQNENDAVKFFLIEFSSDRCMFIMVRDTDLRFRLLNGKYSIYACAFDFRWRRYRHEENLNESVYGNQITWATEKTDGADSEKRGKYYEIGDDGEQIRYENSPYNLANVLDQKLYLIECDNSDYSDYWYIPAIKADENTYINLVSMAKFDVSADMSSQEKMGIPFILDPCAHF